MRNALLALDPGKVSSGWSILDIETGEVLATGMLSCPFSEFAFPHLPRQLKTFSTEVFGLFKHVPDTIVREFVVERYQVRLGKGSGASAEYVNVMLGVSAVLCMISRPPVQFHPVTPVLWKSWLTMLLCGTNKKAEGALEKTPDAFGYHQVQKAHKRHPIPEHVFDSIGQGLHRICERKGLTGKLKPADKALAQEQAKAIIATAKQSIDRIWSEREELLARKVSKSPRSRRVRK